MPHPFLNIRFLQLINYPKGDNAGQLFEPTEKVDIDFYKEYHKIFQELRWYQYRTIDQMMSIDFVRITEYTGYWIVGDIVAVSDYRIDTINKKFDHFILGSQHWSEPFKCDPATKEEFLAWQKEKNK